MDPRIRPIMHRAAAAKDRRDRAGVIAALHEVKPLLAITRTDHNEPQPTIYKFQAAHLAALALESQLAVEFAGQLVCDIAYKLECLRNAYQASKDVDQCRFANFYVRAFVPFVPEHAWADRVFNEVEPEPSVIGGPRPGSDFFFFLRDFATGPRRQLDNELRWADWNYDAGDVYKIKLWSAQVICDLASYLLDQGGGTGRHVEDAQDLATKCVELLERFDDAKSRLLVSDAQSIKARALMRYGDPRPVREEIIACFVESIQIQEQIGTETAAAVDRSNLGAFHFELAVFEKTAAASAWEHAKQLQRQGRSELACKASADAARKQKVADASFDRAEALFMRTLETYRRHPSDRVLEVLLNLGALNAELGNRPKAIEWFSKTCEEAHRLTRTLSMPHLAALSQMGKVLGDMGDLDAAEKAHKQAIDLLDEPGLPNLEPETLLKIFANYGDVLRRLGRIDDAHRYLSTAVDLVEAHGRSFLGLRTAIGLLKSYRWTFELLIDCCTTLGETSAERAAQAFDLAETVKWSLLTSTIRFSPMRLHGQGDDALQREEHFLMHLVGDTLISPAHQAAGNQLVEEALRDLEGIWTKLERIDPEYVAIRRQKTIRADEVPKLLDAQVPVLVEYYFGEHIQNLALAFIFVANMPGVRIVRLPGNPKAVREDLELLREQDDAQPIEAFESLAQRLHQALIAPILPWVPEEVGVCFVPVGDLHNVPFGALYDGEHYLIERNAIVVAPTATALRWWVRNNTRRPQRCLIVTATRDMAIGREIAVDLADFERLARRQIAPLFPVSLLVRPDQATKGRLLEELADVKDPPWDVVHIACHATFESQSTDNALPSSGMTARLVLHGAPGDLAKDLTAGEIFTLVRPTATLVTLSACETAVAQASTNDEIAGLAQGFLFGGASSVLASQWYVVQGIGVELTRQFYASWIGLRGEPPISKVEALRRAQRKLMHRKSWFFWQKKRHPYLWSAFQLLGDWR